MTYPNTPSPAKNQCALQITGPGQAPRCLPMSYFSLVENTWAPSRGYISHRCMQIVQIVLLGVNRVYLQGTDCPGDGSGKKWSPSKALHEWERQEGFQQKSASPLSCESPLKILCRFEQPLAIRILILNAGMKFIAPQTTEKRIVIALISMYFIAPLPISRSVHSAVAN